MAATADKRRGLGLYLDNHTELRAALMDRLLDSLVNADIPDPDSHDQISIEELLRALHPCVISPGAASELNQASAGLPSLTGAAQEHYGGGGSAEPFHQAWVTPIGLQDWCQQSSLPILDWFLVAVAMMVWMRCMRLARLLEDGIKRQDERFQDMQQRYLCNHRDRSRTISVSEVTEFQLDRVRDFLRIKVLPENGVPLQELANKEVADPYFEWNETAEPLLRPRHSQLVHVQLQAAMEMQIPSQFSWFNATDCAIQLWVPGGPTIEGRNGEVLIDRRYCDGQERHGAILAIEVKKRLTAHVRAAEHAPEHNRLA
ncbi:hypothetical protein JKP88DRAFT_322412 [Tribonema minus]|uniref:Uncharacterized protein n=1 Tax=Tribonema minus TaxID=303371 RepID=A0A836CEK6_9STRA|nr:hypothetical protein JKP88DRAFT_322412 [Tribonema minus]